MSAQTYIDCYAPAKTYYDTCKHAVVLLPGAVYNCSTGNKIPQRDIANFKGIIIADTTWQLAGYTVGLNYKGTYVEQSVTGNTFPEYFRLKMAECTYNKFFIDNIRVVNAAGQKRQLQSVFFTITDHIWQRP